MEREVDECARKCQVVWSARRVLYSFSWEECQNIWWQWTGQRQGGMCVGVCACLVGCCCHCQPCVALFCPCRWRNWRSVSLSWRSLLAQDQTSRYTVTHTQSWHTDTHTPSLMLFSFIHTNSVYLCLSFTLTPAEFSCCCCCVTIHKVKLK